MPPTATERAEKNKLIVKKLVKAAMHILHHDAVISDDRRVTDKEAVWEINRLNDAFKKILRRDIAQQIEEAEAAARDETWEAAVVIANCACRAGEKCQRDGGCRHVPCLVARQIAAALRARKGCEL